MSCSCCRLCLRSCAGITALNLSCVGTQTTLVFFISHVAAITSAAHVKGIVGSKRQQLDPLNAPLLTTLLTFPNGFTRLPTTFIFQAEQVLLINRSTERPAGPLPSLHLLSSALIDIHVMSVVENYHCFQTSFLHSVTFFANTQMTLFCLSLAFTSCVIHPSSSYHRFSFALGHRVLSCIPVVLGRSWGQSCHVASLLQGHIETNNYPHNLEFLLCLSDNKALGEGGLWGISVRLAGGYGLTENLMWWRRLKNYW